MSCLLACVMVAWVAPVSAGYGQKEETVAVGVGRDARRSVSDERKPESKSNGGARKTPCDETLIEPPAGHTIDEIQELEGTCLEEVNHLRVANNIIAMVADRELLAVARAYSKQMAEQHFFSHIDPQGRDVRQRLEKAGITWRMVGENLSYSNGYINPVATSVRGWMNSPGHRRNILEGRYNDSAIGVWIASDGTIYFTEIFLRK